MGSGPRAGLAELRLPELQKGSSIMPGKVNPVIPEVVIQVAAQVIGNDAAITVAGSQGQFELNVRVPLIARNLLDSIKLLASASRLLDEKCVAGIEANEEMTERHAEATLATATALNPHIGYDRAAEIVKEAAESGRSLREVALEQGVERGDPRAGARPPPDGPPARVDPPRRRLTRSQPRTRSRRSTIARSRPRPHRTTSRVPSAARIRSRSSPPRKRSRPAPPLSTSRPPLPRMSSRPLSPWRRSAPRCPLSRSAPLPP